MQTYALTILTHQRRSIFTRTANADLMQETLFHHRSQRRYQLHAFAIMPDHMHVLLTPERSLPRCIQFLKGSFSHAVREQYKGEVWHPGHYEHRIRDAADFENQKTYIAQNPARRHLQNYVYVHTRYREQIDPMPSHLR
jgi:REP element-mobilizing transposase RayT